LTGSNARIAFSRRARTAGDSVRTTYGRKKNTEAFHDVGVGFPTIPGLASFVLEAPGVPAVPSAHSVLFVEPAVST
jgi:hypothetical protein